MGQRAYKLRDEYKDTLVGGHITTGVDGRGVNIQDLLEEGNGEIITEDAAFQSVLQNFYGAEGLVFDAFEVQGDERIPAALQQGPPIMIEQPPVQEPAVAPATAPPVNPPVARSGQTSAATPAAQHGDVSDYAKMQANELREIATERQLNVSGNASKNVLVQALEQDDRNRAANPS